MKKIISVIILVMGLLLPVSVYAIDFKPEEAEPCYFFLGERIINIDYNGEIFVGINSDFQRNGFLVTSSDFQNWTVIPGLPSVNCAVYMNGMFLAFNKGVTLKSYNGIDWEVCENNLPITPTPTIWDNEYAKNSKAVVIYGFYNSDNTGGATFCSEDGFVWEKVENIPDGHSIRLINDMFVIESWDRMEGIYVSNDGYVFTRLDAPGYSLTYGNGKYMTRDTSSHPTTVWESEDLVNWVSRDDCQGYPYTSGSLHITIDGVVHCLGAGGKDLVFNGIEWETGVFDMGFQPDIAGNWPYVQYNVTPYGILIWQNVNGYKSYFLKDFTEYIVYDHSVYKYPAFSLWDGTFYATTSSGAVYESLDGLRWTLCGDDIIQATEYKNVNSEHSLTATNGSVTFSNEYVEYDNSGTVSTAQITDADGNSVTVAYDGTWSATCFWVQGGDGFFLLQPRDMYHRYPGLYSFISPDGITRYPFGKTTRCGCISNGEIVLFCDDGVIYTLGFDTLKNLELPPAVKVKLFDEYLSFTTPPYIEDGYVYVPMEFLFNRMGAIFSKYAYYYGLGITWCSFGIGGNRYSMKYNAEEASMNGEPIDLKGLYIVGENAADAMVKIPYNTALDLYDVFGIYMTYDTESETLIILESYIPEYGTDMNKPIPREAVAMLETFYDAIAIGDEELYKSLFVNFDESLMHCYYSYLGVRYTIKEVKTSVTNIDEINSGDYFVSVYVENDDGSGEASRYFGITKDKTTGKWRIFDID